MLNIGSETYELKNVIDANFIYIRLN